MNMTRNRITVIALEALIALALAFALISVPAQARNAEDTSRRRSPWRAAQSSVDFLSNALASARAPIRGRWRITKRFGTARLQLSKTTSKGKFDIESFHLFRRMSRDAVFRALGRPRAMAGLR
jgi:hypothetical protein